MNRRFLATIALVMIVMMLVNGCSSNSNSINKAEKKEKSKNKIAMVIDKGGLVDKSFYDAANIGLNKIEKEYGIKPTIIESTGEESYGNDLKSASKDNDLIIAAGFTMKNSLQKIAIDTADKSFVIIDAEVDEPNVKSVIFKEEEGSFLMGIIAGKMTKTNKVGFIGGIESEIIERFEAGFIAGVKTVNEAAAEDLLNKKNVKYAGNFNDLDKGYELGKSLYNNGCDIVYHASGSVGLGLFKAAKEMKKWVIGVDQDQGEIVSEYKDNILSSMVKYVDKSTYEVTKEFIEGQFKGGKDSVMKLGIKEGGVGIAASTKENIPKDIVDLVEKYKKSIVASELEVPTSTNKIKEFKAPELK